MSKSGAQKQRSIACRPPPKSPPARIARRISLCLDNSSADPAPSGLAHNGLPNKESGQVNRADRQAGSRQPPNFMSEFQLWLQQDTRPSIFCPNPQPTHFGQLTRRVRNPLQTLPPWNQYFAQKHPFSHTKYPPKSHLSKTLHKKSRGEGGTPHPTKCMMKT